MPDASIDELGPVDFLVVEFPAGTHHFNGEMVDELTALVNAELIRMLDLLVLRKDGDGSIEAIELEDLEEGHELRTLAAHVAELLTADDVVKLAHAMDPGSVACVIVWENTWAAPFASAARRAGGQLIADGRIPMQAIVASLQCDQEQDQ
jgi:hypothetical protein